MVDTDAATQSLWAKDNDVTKTLDAELGLIGLVEGRMVGGCCLLEPDFLQDLEYFFLDFWPIPFWEK